MTPPEEPRNHAFVRFRTDVVTKPDGRYLIYYSWPDEDAAETGEAAARPEPPAQAPWSPEAGPSDV